MVRGLERFGYSGWWGEIVFREVDKYVIILLYYFFNVHHSSSPCHCQQATEGIAILLFHFSSYLAFTFFSLICFLPELFLSTIKISSQKPQANYLLQTPSQQINA